MGNINPGSVINSLDGFIGESHTVFPRIIARRYRAYAKIGVDFATTMPLFIPSRKKDVADKAFTLGGNENVYSIVSLLTVGVSITTTERLKISDAVANTGGSLITNAAGGSGKISAGFLSPSQGIPGSTLSAPLGPSGNIGNGPLQLFVTNSVGTTLSSTGIKVDPTPTTDTAKALLKKYASQAYLLVDICTYEGLTSDSTATLDENIRVNDSYLTATFKGF